MVLVRDFHVVQPRMECGISNFAYSNASVTLQNLRTL